MESIFIYQRKRHSVIKLCLIWTLLTFIKSDVLDLTDDNFDHYISTYEFVFINFHAEWCPFSNRLIPILKEVSQIIAEEYKEPNRVLIARLNCDENPRISSRYKIVKYPTIKTFLNGKALKKEYRESRNTEGFTKYIRQLLVNPVVHIQYNTFEDLSAIFYNKSAIIGYFDETPEKHWKYSSFRRVATDLRGYCEFYWVTGSPFLKNGQKEMLAFKSYRSTTQSEYDFIYQTYDELSAWSTYLCIHLWKLGSNSKVSKDNCANSLCIPIVREITFENAEEIIEEGLPLVILFHASEDEDSLQMFKTIIQKELVNQTSFVNFVTADGAIFAHPLTHIDKTIKDLPLIALDSFEHMYLFPKFEDLNKTHILAKFIEDMKSGKLHRQYHFGDDYAMDLQEDETEETPTPDPKGKNIETEAQLNVEEESLKPIAESVFKNLGPSQRRYSLLMKDEL